MTTLPLAARLSRRLNAIIRPIRRNRSMAELAHLDERLLRDIGLSRVDIQAMRRMW